MDAETLQKWVNINSGSDHAAGLRKMTEGLVEALSGIPGDIERIALDPVLELDGTTFQPGECIRLRFNPDAPLKVLFSGHMDTVFGKEHSFQSYRALDGSKATGPGIADMKGGLFILIRSVKAFLEKDESGQLGGEILITGDEEVGSPGSQAIIREAAANNDLGLVFESALPDGALVCQRKGTGTYRIVATGKAAHTGRDYASGRNAAVALSALMVSCHQLNDVFPDAIINVGRIEAGGPVNVVPDHAEAWLNVRAGKPETVPAVEAALLRLINEAGNSGDGITYSSSGSFSRPPKEESSGDAKLHALWNAVEADLGVPASGKRDTGGSSDGNILGDAGLPHLDGVGIQGGKIHSDQEFALLDSIDRQVDKVVGFLQKLATDPEPYERR